MTSPLLADGASTYTPGISERRGSTTTYQLDGLKNTFAQSNASGGHVSSRNYDAFGAVTSSSGTHQGPFGYGGAYGYQTDPDTGLMLLGHRYYDSSTGRFLTRDPIKDGRNWYGYGGGYANPVNSAVLGVAIVSCLPIYLNAMQRAPCYHRKWDLEPVSHQKRREVRRELLRRFSGVFASFPRRPPAHGREVDSWWTLFPVDLVVTEEEWLGHLYAAQQWYIVDGNPTLPSWLLLNALSVQLPLPRCDLCFWTPEIDGLILAIDHEREGPWILTPSKKKRRLCWARQVFPSKSFEIPGLLLDRHAVNATRRWLRRRLSQKSIYVPSYPLRTTGPFPDHLWNYFGREHGTSLGPDSIAVSCFRRATSVLCWTEDDHDEAWILSSDLWPLLTHIPDAYYLEWPERRWLIAVPRARVVSPKDPWVDASFIVLE